MGEELSFILASELSSLIRGKINREEMFVHETLIELLFLLFFAEVVTTFLQ